ncbi:MAG: AraC family transcriptional regulator [Bacteroidales bacterium]|nr:AraC family transcriptional regulator [Bacteroidales bacterium]
MIRIIAPSPLLRPFVRYHWVMSTETPFRALTFPIGCPQLLFHRKDVLTIPELSAAQERFTVSGQVCFSSHVCATRPLETIATVFRPHTIMPFIGVPPSAFYNVEISGHDLENRELSALAGRVLSAASADIAVSLIERYLMSRLDVACDINLGRMGRAVSVMLADPSVSVGALASQSCLCQKQFERVFRHSVGMNPKKYQGIVRFQRALRLIQCGSENIADIAAAAGYADQSHFTRECRNLVSLTPLGLIKSGTAYSDLYTEPV